MTTGYRIDKQDAAYFTTLTVVEWVDLFVRDNYKQLIADSLNYCVKEKGLEIFAYVIMTNHIHLISRAKFANLSDIHRDFKKYTSNKLIEEIQNGLESRKDWMLEIFRSAAAKHERNKKFQVWIQDNHAEEVYSAKFTLSKIKYIHNNPVEEGIVQFPEQYLYSSASDYAGRKSPVEVSVINLHNLYY
jgi:putative transposase